MVETVTNKIAVMASVFPPQKKGGGPAVSISNFVKCLENHSRIYVISHNHEINSKDKLEGVVGNSWNKYDDINVYYFNYGDDTIKNIFNLLCEIKPKYIYQNSYFTYEQAVAALLYRRIKDKSVSIIIAPRGEFGVEKLKIGSFKKYLYHNALKILGLLKNVIWQGSGDKDINDIKKFVPTKNVINLDNLPCLYDAPKRFTTKNENEIRLVTIGRIHPIKNLITAIESLMYVNSNVSFDIYGPIEDEDYWNKCKEKINLLPENVRVNYCGFLEHENISKTLLNYHAFFSPTCGENFGQSLVDAMMNATPVIVSDQTPWNDVEHAGGGFVVEINDIKGYSKCIDRIAGLDQEKYNEMCDEVLRYIKGKLDIEKIIKQYNELFR